MNENDKNPVDSDVPQTGGVTPERVNDTWKEEYNVLLQRKKENITRAIINNTDELKKYTNQLSKPFKPEKYAWTRLSDYLFDRGFQFGEDASYYLKDISDMDYLWIVFDYNPAPDMEYDDDDLLYERFDDEEHDLYDPDVPDDE